MRTVSCLQCGVEVPVVATGSLQLTVHYSNKFYSAVVQYPKYFKIKLKY